MRLPGAQLRLSDGLFCSRGLEAGVGDGLGAPADWESGPGAAVSTNWLDPLPEGTRMTGPLEPAPDVLPDYFSFETDVIMEIV